MSKVWEPEGVRGEAVVKGDTVIVGAVLLSKPEWGKGKGEAFLGGLKENFSTIIGVGITNSKMRRVLPRKGFKLLHIPNLYGSSYPPYEVYYWTSDPSVSPQSITSTIQELDTTRKGKGDWVPDINLKPEDYPHGAY